MKTEAEREHERDMAKIEARKVKWAASPFWFTVWDVATDAIALLMLMTLAQCTCAGCIW